MKYTKIRQYVMCGINYNSYDALYENLECEKNEWDPLQRLRVRGLGVRRKKKGNFIIKKQNKIMTLNFVVKKYRKTHLALKNIFQPNKQQSTQWCTKIMYSRWNKHQATGFLEL